jgi:DNA-nicking Smr family endonuclease
MARRPKNDRSAFGQDPGEKENQPHVPDLHVWERYAKAIAPRRQIRTASPTRLSPGAPSPKQHEEPESFAALLGEGAQAPSPPTRKTNNAPKHRPQADAATKIGVTPTGSKPRVPVSVPGTIDVHVLRRTKRGGGVDARIDLHGLRRDEAYHALLGFLGDCQHRSLKLVLVITGKGTNSRQAQDWWDMPERGVLKRQVPQWLRQPAFARLVAGFSEAGRGDGGSGALYVQLRGGRKQDRDGG